jgi:hypothetical protein
MKGASNIDYVIAFGIFIMVFGLTISLTTNYYSGVNEVSKIVVLRGEAMDILNSLSDEPFPSQWSDGPEVLGISGKAYSFVILVNNTASNYFNSGVTAETLTLENVSFSYTTLGLTDIDVNSTAIYNETGNYVSYNVAGTVITFSIPIQASEERWFTVYFDDTSNFTDYSTTVTGASNVNNITEKLYPAQQISIVEYREIQRMQESVYSAVKNATGTRNDFNIEIFDTETNSTFANLGGSPPKRGDVVSLERSVLFQNSTAHVIRGTLIVKVW